jgi:hypothetical protein
LAESWWPGSTGVVDFSQGTRKLRAGGQVSLVLDFVSPSRAAPFGPIASGESVQFPNNRYSTIPIDSEITAGSVFTRFIETI